MSPTLKDSYWQMLVLLTTENYPFVFLQGFEGAWYSVLIFWFFIVVCIFLLQSVVLGLVFENYKERVNELQQERMSNRLFYIEYFYDMFDKDGDGYLTYREAKDFFKFVLDLNFNKPKHRKTFVKIIKIVDPEKYQVVLKERIVDFFAISGFNIIAQLD